MSDTTQTTARRARNSVIWPDPSPLDPWWHNVMYPDGSPAQSGPSALCAGSGR